MTAGIGEKVIVVETHASSSRLVPASSVDAGDQWAKLMRNAALLLGLHFCCFAFCNRCRRWARSPGHMQRLQTFPFRFLPQEPGGMQLPLEARWYEYKCMINCCFSLRSSCLGGPCNNKFINSHTHWVVCLRLASYWRCDAPLVQYDARNSESIWRHF